MDGWSKEWGEAATALKKVKEEVAARKQTPLQVLRVNQLDALHLDQEINETLSTQFFNAFHFLKVDKFKPELEAFLHLLIYAFSIFSLGTTYGNRLQNLRYADGRGFGGLSTVQRVLYGLLTIGGRWAWQRLHSYTASALQWEEREGGRRGRLNQRAAVVWRAMNSAERVYRAIALLNFLVFLYNGQYISLVARLLKMRLVFQSPSAKRTVSFDFMNKQLVWQEFTEFLMFIIPLVRVDKMKTWASKLLFSTGPQSNLPPNVCPICRRENIQLPYLSSCGHLFCYYCLKQNMMADQQYNCPKCGNVITSLQRATNQ